MQQPQRHPVSSCSNVLCQHQPQNHHHHLPSSSSTSSLTTTNSTITASNSINTKEYYIYQRREYDEGMNMYYAPIRMDASTCIGTLDASSMVHHHQQHTAAATVILYYNLGQTYLRQDLDDEAQKYFELAMHHYHQPQQRQPQQQSGRRTNTTTTTATMQMSVAQQTAAFHYVPPFKVLHNLGYIQYRAQNITGAIETFRRALAESRHSIHSLDVANSLNCLGVLYFHLPNPMLFDPWIAICKPWPFARKCWVRHMSMLLPV
jgi:tetratricopeptide (TPR) repeat protein